MTDTTKTNPQTDLTLLQQPLSNGYIYYGPNVLPMQPGQWQNATAQSPLANNQTLAAEANKDPANQLMDSAVSIWSRHGAAGVIWSLFLKSHVDISQGLGPAITKHFGPGIWKRLEKHPRLLKMMGILALLCLFGGQIYKKVVEFVVNIMSWALPNIQIPASDKLLHNRVLKYVAKRSLPTFSRVSHAESAENAKTIRYAKVVDANDVLFHHTSGFNLFRLGWRWFVLTRQRALDSSPGDLTIWSFGLSSIPLQKLIREANLAEKDAQLIVQSPTTKPLRPVSISRPVWNGHNEFYWNNQGETYPRSMDSVVMPTELKEELITDIETFLHPDTAKRCAELGQPYRRNLLMHGPPGTGKTSIAMAIASTYHLNVYVVSLLEKHMTDQRLMILFKAVQKDTLVLMEDIDSAGIGRQLDLTQSDGDKGATNSSTVQVTAKSNTAKGQTINEKAKLDEHKSTVTLSGVLNSRDCINSPTGHMLIMTTNHKDRLDEALMRRGRADKDFYFGYATKEQISGIFSKVYTPGSVIPLEKLPYKAKDVPDMAEQFADVIPNEELSPASIIGFLLQHDHKPKSALQKAKAWVEKELAYINKGQKKEQVKKSGFSGYAINKTNENHTGYDQDGEDEFYGTEEQPFGADNNPQDFIGEDDGGWNGSYSYSNRGGRGRGRGSGW